MNRRKWKNQTGRDGSGVHGMKNERENVWLEKRMG